MDPIVTTTSEEQPQKSELQKAILCLEQANQQVKMMIQELEDE
jgi:hypothetical protein